MKRETQEIAERVSVALATPLPEIPAPPAHIYTLARGSSDHAATMVHRLLRAAQLPSTTLPPSMLREPLVLSNSLLLAISQSGASPDLSTAARVSREQDCPVLALTNQLDSALARESTVHINIRAGRECAVAATKSVVCSVLAGARVAEYWGARSFSLEQLPEQIFHAQQQQTDELVELFVKPGPLLVIGRGLGLGVACEVALKVQELLGKAAMAYSSAEVLHGPAGMIVPGYPVLALAVGPDAPDVLSTTKQLRSLGAQTTVISIAPRVDGLAALINLTHIYVALEIACRQLGRSPDKPANLRKVTRTH